MADVTSSDHHSSPWAQRGFILAAAFIAGLVLLGLAVLLLGGGGNDVLRGAGGRDVVSGGDGDDTLTGGEGNDALVETRFGDDKLLDGGPGDDYVDGNRGSDRMVGGDGEDIMRGGNGNDTFFARDGSQDLIDCGPGYDVVKTVDRQENGVFNCEKVIYPKG